MHTQRYADATSNLLRLTVERLREGAPTCSSLAGLEALHERLDLANEREVEDRDAVEAVMPALLAFRASSDLQAIEVAFPSAEVRRALRSYTAMSLLADIERVDVRQRTTLGALRSTVSAIRDDEPATPAKADEAMDALSDMAGAEPEVAWAIDTALSLGSLVGTPAERLADPEDYDEAWVQRRNREDAGKPLPQWFVDDYASLLDDRIHQRVWDWKDNNAFARILGNGVISRDRTTLGSTLATTLNRNWRTLYGDALPGEVPWWVRGIDVAMGRFGDVTLGEIVALGAVGQRAAA